MVYLPRSAGSTRVRASLVAATLWTEENSERRSATATRSPRQLFFLPAIMAPDRSPPDFSHGIVFTPDDVQQEKTASEIAKALENARYVRIYWVDLVNIRRCRIVPIAHFKSLLASNRPGVNIAKVVLGLVHLVVAPGFLPVGEYLYAIDLSSIRPAPFAPGHLAVLGTFEEKAPVEGSVGVGLCPRTLLRRITNTLESEFHTRFLVGFESEFILLKSTDPVEPVNIHDFAASTGLLTGTPEAAALQEIADSITAAGIALEMVHAEAAPGQYEVVTGPLTPLEAADALIHTREIIVQVAAKHGLHATFAPRPFMSSAGSSTHAHVSVHSTSEEKPATRLSQRESHFLAGLLAHLRGITALTLPTPASYKRVGDGLWSGGTYVCYGTENREAPVRLTNAASPASRNFELRFIDGTANPHLALAGVLTGGLLGVRDEMVLGVKDCAGPRSAAEMSEAERDALGIRERMPLGCEEGRNALEGDVELRGVLGEEFVERYLAVNRTLESVLVDDKETEEQRLTRWVRFF
ncbi:1,2-dihydroxy-3-keto-5-methylthiopentene dioxygenase [Mycena chlorophos]|uniref:Glutamine synthetase n=1 Tax=Mycena chlorophos TaxID=658473 RepID=A0A8H6VTY8_MYCCL|nr:1,2-dihydroxy-3-keto-5-methylthiopentene dioxygenase [Mycena chlorophos]